LPRGNLREVTISLDAPAPAAGTRPNPRFLSLAYPRAYIDRQFWEVSQPLLIAAGAFTCAGAAFLVGGILLAFGQLERSRREIEQTARARTSLLTERGMLASVLAHEVRSPLTALRFNLHSLRGLLAATPAAATSPATPADSATDTAAPDKRLELTDRCEREIHRLDRMLNDFLQRTQVHAVPEPASLNRIIMEAVEFLTPALEERNIRVSLHLDPADPHVSVHPDELRQVVLNLAANAMDAMPPPKGGTLAISTVAREDEPSASAAGPGAPMRAADRVTPSTMLLIRDSGTGIPQEHLERIFEPFFSTKSNGSGLGLTLVRRVVSGAGGTLFVESTPATPGGHGGTTVRILLPPSNEPGNAGQGYAHRRSPGTAEEPPSH
jgi:signal transduction histidine kinase